MVDPQHPSQAGLLAELAAVAAGLETMAQSVETNMSEERLSGIVAAEQEINQRKFQRLNLILALTLVVMVIGLSGIWSQSRANHDQGARIQATSRDAAVVADYVKSCLQTPAAQRDRAQCGADGTAAVISGLVRYIGCAVLADPPTKAKIDTCASESFGGTP